jgi:preprotein translocase SecE subunit
MKFFTYIKESFAETKHVKWPTKKEAAIYTLAVIVIAFAVAYYIGLFDMIFTKGLEQIIN